MNSEKHDESAFDFLAMPNSAALTDAKKKNEGSIFQPEVAERANVPRQPVIADAELGVSEDFQPRLEQVLAASNPLIEAARSLLRMLAEMPASLDTEGVAGLRALLVREVSLFQKLCDKADLSWKHMAVARYCLCTALDEAANRTRWGGRGVWAAQSLLITFEGEVDGGEKFFLLVGRMATDPQEYTDALEVLYRILGLGFEGRYSVVTDGRRHLEQIRQRLWTLITGARDTIQPELSLHWRGTEPGRMPFLRSVPVWATASIAALVIFGLFAWYQYHLLSARKVLEARILAIGQATVVEKKQQLRLSVLLKNEIDRGLLTVNEDARRSEVIFKGDYMFVSGKSQVRQEMKTILEKVGREVARVEGRVVVTGHTDNQKINTKEFPNNLVLSEKRAAFVAEILQSYGTAANRIQSVGRGDSQPLADNATAEGRALNRRVEIVVTL